MRGSILVAALCAAASAQTGQWKDLSPHRAQMVRVAPGVELEVLDWGGSGRALILLAGSGNSAHVFDDFAPLAAKFARVYGITRRGYGKSSKPESGYGELQLAADILAVADALHLDRPMLAGHSMAGGEITALGTEHADRWGGLIYFDALSDPRDFPASDPEYMKLFRALPAPMRRGSPDDSNDRTIAGYLRRQMEREHFAFPESELRAVYATNADGTMGAHLTPSSIHRAIGDGARKRDYRGIRVPVLAFIDMLNRGGPPPPGEYVPKNDEERRAIEAFGRATAAFVNRWIAYLRAAVPAAHVVDLPGAGHYLFLTRTTEVLAEMRRFCGAGF
jgi:pimeloyl-ACP methyl ester carboxylesterase